MVCPVMTQQVLRQGCRLRLRFTNLTRTFKGTLDYILYTSNSLAPTAVLELPEELEVRPLPHELD